MTNFTGTELTALGRALFAKQGKQIVFTRAETGKGTYEKDESVETLTSLKEKVQEFSFSSVEELDDTDVFLKFIVSNKELTEDYLFTEIGVYAQDADVGEILYAVCYAIPDEADNIHAYNGIFESRSIISLRMVVASSADVSMMIDSGIYALNEDVLRYQRDNEKARNGVLQDANQFTINKIADLINGASETLDTLKEVADAIAENKTVVEALDSAIGTKLDKTGDAKDAVVTFSEAAERTNISSGEKLSIILGKIKRFFTDLKTVAFTGSYADLADKPTIPEVKWKELGSIHSGETLTVPSTAVEILLIVRNGASSSLVFGTKVLPAHTQFNVIEKDFAATEQISSLSISATGRIYLSLSDSMSSAHYYSIYYR